jgi:hypothetical protein
MSDRSMSDFNQPELIRARMAEIRAELRQDVVDAVDQAKQFIDWRNLVRVYPWASLSLAAGVGYVMVPRKKGADTGIHSPRAGSHSDFQDGLQAGSSTNQERPGLAGIVLSIASAAALRAGTALVSQQLARLVGSAMDDSSQSRPTETAKAGGDHDP